MSPQGDYFKLNVMEHIKLNIIWDVNSSIIMKSKQYWSIFHEYKSNVFLGFHVMPSNGSSCFVYLLSASSGSDHLSLLLGRLVLQNELSAQTEVEGSSLCDKYHLTGGVMLPGCLLHAMSVWLTSHIYCMMWHWKENPVTPLMDWTAETKQFSWNESCQNTVSNHNKCGLYSTFHTINAAQCRQQRK